MVSVGSVGSEWLDSECKNAHFQAFPQSTPSVSVSKACAYMCHGSVCASIARNTQCTTVGIKVTTVAMGGDLQPGFFADRLLTGLGQPRIQRLQTKPSVGVALMVTMGGDLQPGCLADRLLTGFGQPQIHESRK